MKKDVFPFFNDLTEGKGMDKPKKYLPEIWVVVIISLMAAVLLIILLPPKSRGVPSVESMSPAGVSCTREFGYELTGVVRRIDYKAIDGMLAVAEVSYGYGETAYAVVPSEGGPGSLVPGDKVSLNACTWSGLSGRGNSSILLAKRSPQ